MVWLQLAVNVVLLVAVLPFAVVGFLAGVVGVGWRLGRSAFDGVCAIAEGE